MNAPFSMLDDWQARLVTAERMSHVPDSSAWIFEIRAKILRYMISRYEHVADQMHTTPADDIRPLFYLEAPRKRRDFKDPCEMRARLERIHEVNLSRNWN